MTDSAVLENAASEAAPTPAHQNVYAALRDQVLFGDLAPGQAITIQGLQSELGAGMTPVREALRRLTSEGAIEMLGNRRLCVPVLDRKDVDELFFMRKMLEPELARRAAQHIGPDEIEALRQIDDELNQTIERGDIKGYLRQNYLFHRRLYLNADAPVIADTVDRLWLRFGPSLRENCGRVGTANLPDKHADLIAALIDGDAFGAARAAGDDVMQGMNLYLMGGDSIDAE